MKSAAALSKRDEEQVVSPRRGIPSLDGLRAISVVMVVGLHTLQRYSATHAVGLGWFVLLNGALGVRIFFVISGYLITRLLLREREKTGTIGLGSFYVRRAFRILPPLYVYLLFLLALAAAGLLKVRLTEVLAAALFVRNYATGQGLWALEHTWSLCIEEQFYLLWPAVLVACTAGGADLRRGRAIAARVALVVIVVSPIVRLASFAAHVPYLHNATMFHMQADPLMFGCLAALLEGRARFERMYAWVTRRWWIPAVLLFLVSGTLELRFQNYWMLPLGLTVDGFLLMMLILWAVRNADSAPGRLLNFAPVRRLGMLSYSIYLWQTFFLHERNLEVFGGHYWINTFPGNWLAILVCAVISYYAVEQPALRLRDRWVRRHDARNGAIVT